jgi:anaerobic selenocysteine-containing dehydrogenase
MRMSEVQGEKTVRTTCAMDCGCRTTILAHIRDGVLVKVEPADFPDSRYRYICARGLCIPKLVYHPDRLKYPMKRIGERGEGKWQRLSWDEALDTIASRFRDIQNKYGRRSLAWATSAMGAQSALSPAYLRFTSACEGTWVTLIGPGDSAGLCGDVISYGVDRGQLLTIDFEKPELLVLWGDNAAVTEPFTWIRVRQAKERGAKVVVVDPLFTTTASKADEYIPIRPGTDAALALGMMNVILGQGLHDESFIVNNTVGPFLVRSDNGLFAREKDIGSGKGTDEYLVWDTKSNNLQTPDVPGVVASLRGTYTVGGIECKPAFQLLAELIAQYTPEKTSGITGLPSDTIRRLATECATRKPVANFTGWGAQRTFHGDLSWRAITTLAAITGNISLKGLHQFVLNRSAFTNLPGKTFEQVPLLQLYEAILTDRPYPIKALWIAKHNFVNQGPNINKIIKELLPRLEFIVTADVFMSASAQYADIVLPACTQYEFTDLIVPQPHAHTYLMLQQKVIEPLYESKPDLDILTELAGKMGLGEFFDKSAEEYIELLLSSGHPSMEGITLEDLKKGPVPLPSHSIPAFTTPSGRFEFYSERLKKFGQELPIYLEPLESARQTLAQRYPLSYLSTHSRFRAHSQFANISWLRELDPEPVLEMNPVDAEKRGIRDTDIVVVFNDRGRVKLKAKIHEGIRPGVVNIPQGWEPSNYIEGSHQALTHDVINQVQQSVFVPNPAYSDNLVEVQKAKE